MTEFQVGQYVRYTAEYNPCVSKYKGTVGRIVGMSFDDDRYVMVKFFCDAETYELSRTNLQVITSDEALISRLEN